MLDPAPGVWSWLFLRVGSLGFLLDVDGPGGGREMRRLWEFDEGPGVGAGGEEAGGEDIIIIIIAGRGQS